MTTQSVPMHKVLIGSVSMALSTRPEPNTSYNSNAKSKRAAFRRFIQTTFFKTKWTKIEILTSICLYLHIIPWGLYCGALSTTLLDLELLNNCSTTQIGLMFTAITLGALVGAPVGGLILSKVDCRAYCALVCCLFACTITALPWSGNFTKLLVVGTIHGIFQGAQDSGLNVTALLIWGWDRTFFLQTFHSLFAIGTFIGPWLTKPFLAPSMTHSILDNETVSVSIDINMNTTGNVTNVYHGRSRVYISYFIIGIIMFVVGIVYLIIFVITKGDFGCTKKVESEEKKESFQHADYTRNPNQSKRWYMVSMAVLAFIRFACYVGLELTFPGFLMIFCVTGLGWEKTDSYVAATTYWGSFACSRFAAIFLVMFFSPTTMVAVDVILMILGILVLAIFANYHPFIIILCSAAFGLAGGSFYGCSQSWAYKYMNVSAKVGTIFTTGAWFGMAAIPALAGFLIDSIMAKSFIYLCLAVTIILAICTLAATTLGLKYGADLTESQTFVEEGKKMQNIEDKSLTNLDIHNGSAK